ncbi:MAG: methyl-accepting chemotaxis protein [Peptostreptococcaceae bacterium]|nr:methyl-accepting chemotaxis protein [Peptostreptococcaceae bacterium]
MNKLFSGKTGNKQGRTTIMGEIIRWIGMPIIILMLCLTVIVLRTVKTNLVSLAQEKISLETVAFASRVDQQFQKFDLLSYSMAQNQQFNQIIRKLREGEELKKIDGFDESFETLVNMAKSDSYISATWIADEKTNQVWASDGYFSDGSWDIHTREWFTALQENPSMQYVTTEPYFDETIGEMIVTISSPIKDVHGNVIAASGVDVSIKGIFNLMQTEKVGESGFYVLLSKFNDILYHPNQEVIGGNVSGAPINQELKDTIINRNYSLVEFEEFGIPNVGYLAAVGERGWAINSVLPEKEFMRSYNILRNTLVAMLMGAIFAYLALIWRVAKRITKPLAELNGVAEQIAGGDLNVQLDIQSKNEIGMVANSIGQTVNRLRDYVDYIQEISQVLEKMADGDMRIRLTKEYKGEFSSIKDALQLISSSLNNTLTMINQSSEQVNQGSAHVSSAAQSLATGAAEQASSIQNLTESVRVISEQSKNNAQNAENAKTLAMESGKEVELGNQHMNQMLSAMEEISKSSEEIHKIIKAIDDIAFQTNILALNAAVESARAGEAGKGFAVVADEVRSLAVRSAEAAKQTQMLVEESVKNAGIGLGIAKDTAESLGKIRTKTEETSSIVEVIAKSSHEQATTIDEISDGLSSISTVVQSNAATAEQSSAASEELSAQATMLYEEVKKFKLEETRNFINHNFTEAFSEIQAAQINPPTTSYEENSASSDKY